MSKAYGECVNCLDEVGNSTKNKVVQGRTPMYQPNFNSEIRSA